MKSFKLSSVCPFCGKINTGAGAIDLSSRPPQPGDVSVCIDCEEPAIYTDTSGGLRKPTGAENVALAADIDLASCRLAIREANALFGRTPPKKKLQEFECIYLGPRIKV